MELNSYVLMKKIQHNRIDCAHVCVIYILPIQSYFLYGYSKQIQGEIIKQGPPDFGTPANIFFFSQTHNKFNFLIKWKKKYKSQKRDKIVLNGSEYAYLLISVHDVIVFCANDSASIVCLVCEFYHTISYYNDAIDFTSTYFNQ